MSIDEEAFVLEAWNQLELDDLVDAARVSNGAWEDVGLTWSVPRGGAVLMFAGDRASSPVYGTVRLPVVARTYRITSSRLESNDGTGSIYRLIPARRR